MMAPAQHRNTHRNDFRCIYFITFGFYLFVLLTLPQVGVLRNTLCLALCSETHSMNYESVKQTYVGYVTQGYGKTMC